MAELIGAVASGITLAQVAGGIIQTSFKIKRLMSECDEIPARLETLLNQIEILAPIVSEASTNNGALPLQASLNGALHNATTHCQMALDQLNSIAETLSSQIEVSRGIKRKFKLVKALLKGDQIIQCERSLQTAIQLLSLAQQTYIFALLRVQPEIVASQFFRHLDGRSDGPSQESVKDTQIPKLRKKIKNPRKLDNILDPVVRQGLSCVTGTVEIYRSSSEWDIKSSLEGKGQAALLQVKFRLPTWLSSMVIDSTIGHAYSGWTHCLEIYRTHPRKSNVEVSVTRLMEKDDVEGLRRMFRERFIGPLDRFPPISEFGMELSLFSFSTAFRAWKISKYLLQHGPEQHGLISKPCMRKNDGTELRALLIDDRLEDDIRLALFFCFENNQGFSSRRRKIWPDYEYLSHGRLLVSTPSTNQKALQALAQTL